VGDEIVTVVAFTAPADPFEPVAVMQVPTVTSLRLAFRLAMIVVEAVRSTVVWPLSVFCTSSVLPVMLAMLPVAAGLNADDPAAPPAPPVPAPPAAPAPPALVAAAAVVVVVAGGVVAAGALAAVEAPPPQAAASKDMAANKTAAGARWRVLPEGNLKCVTGFVPPISMS
jgi:hypothetical protein